MVTIGERLFLRFYCLLLCFNMTYQLLYRINFVGHFLCGCSGSTDYFPAMVDVVVVHRNDDIVLFAAVTFFRLVDEKAARVGKPPQNLVRVS